MNTADGSNFGTRINRLLKRLRVELDREMEHHFMVHSGTARLRKGPELSLRGLRQRRFGGTYAPKWARVARAPFMFLFVDMS